MKDIRQYVEYVYEAARHQLEAAVADYKKQIGLEWEAGETLDEQAQVLSGLMEIRGELGGQKALDKITREYMNAQFGLRALGQLTKFVEQSAEYECLKRHVQEREGFIPSAPVLTSPHRAWKLGYETGYELASFHCTGSGQQGPEDPAVNPFPPTPAVPASPIFPRRTV